ncbi:MAG: hypothetical protein HRU19_15865 [Pseudobacteriovorax sp.]|nr:hypothetical protein [Pseudobacteriovorax sp.]
MIRRTLFVGFLVSSLITFGCRNSDDDDNAPVYPPLPEAPAADLMLSDMSQRLLIADGAEPRLTMVEIATGEIIKTFDIESVARVYTGPIGNFAYAVQARAGVVDIIDGGFSTNIEQGIPFKLAPSIHSQQVKGALPIHFVGKQGYSAIFFDDEGKARFIPEPIQANSIAESIEIDSGAPHHGVALAFDQFFLLSKPVFIEGVERAAAGGIQAFDSQGQQLDQDFPTCPRLHGEASTSTAVAFGCGDGVLILQAENNTLKSIKVANPQLEDGASPRVGTIAAHDGVPYMIGNFGSQRYVAIDPEKERLDIYDLPIDYARFAFSKDGEKLIFLSKDGELLIVSSDDHSVIHRSKVTSPSTGENHGATDPKMVVAPGFVFVTDPAKAVVHAFSLDRMSIVSTYEVGGRTYYDSDVRFSSSRLVCWLHRPAMGCTQIASSEYSF